MSNVDRVFAVVCVSDLAKGAAWYSDLIGRRPDQTPVDGLHEWYFGDGGLQLLQVPDRAGKSSLTFLVPDLDVFRQAIGEKGMKLGDEATAAHARAAQINDPDGNIITVAQPSVGDAAASDADAS